MTSRVSCSFRLPRTRVQLALALIAVSIGTTSVASAQANDPIIAKVNGIAIRQSSLALADAEIGKNFPTEDADRKRDFLINYLTDMILVGGAATDAKTINDAIIQRRIMFVKDKILMERVIDNINKNAATEDAIRKAYDETASLMATEEEFHVRAIVLRVPADATDTAKADVAAKINTVAERLKKGEDFGVVAKEISDDPVGRARGGDLGHLSKLQMGPKFSEVASKLTDGQISDPFETEGGWTIVNVLGRRMRQVPPYEQVKGQVEAYVKGKAQFALVEKLRAEAKIEHPDDKLPETKP